MQGVRSKISCDGCKRRKKGCDLKKPCGRCSRLGIQCRYALREYKFVVPGTTLLSADNDAIIKSAFWQIYLPPQLNPWITVAHSLSHPHLTHALHAISYASMGWYHDDPFLVQRGLAEYTSTLRLVNRGLDLSDTTLACCRILSLFEMFRRLVPGESQAAAWRQHAEGTYQLIRMRGKAHTDTELQLYDGVRFTAAIQGLTQRRSNSFTSLEWSVRREGNLRDWLLDMACRFVPLLELTDKDGADVVSYLNFIEELAAFEEALKESCGHALLACVEQDYGTLYLAAQYWAVCVIVHESARRLALVAGVVLPVDPELYAVNIVDIAPYFFQPDAGLWSAQAAIFPFGMALRYFSTTGRTGGEYSKALLKAMQGKMGSIVLDFLQSMRAEAR